jgi:excisionase family DNA binding protein
MTVEPFVTTDEVARFICKPKSWIYNNAEDLGMPIHRIGRQWRWKLSEVDTWVKTGTQIPRQRRGN